MRTAKPEYRKFLNWFQISMKTKIPLTRIWTTSEKRLKIHGIDNTLWVRGLSSVITGKALETFSSLSMETLENYEQVKAALLERYQIGAEHYRKQFRELRKSDKENYNEVGHKLQTLWAKWVASKGATGDPLAIAELILVEQFYAVLPEGLKVWLRDRDPKTLKECCKLADNHAANRENFVRNKPWGKANEGSVNNNVGSNPTCKIVTSPTGPVVCRQGRKTHGGPQT